MKNILLAMHMLLLMHIHAHAQDVSVHKRVMEIEKEIEKIDGSKKLESYRIQTQDSIYPAEGVAYPNVFGYWDKDALVRIFVKYEDAAGMRWENSYYYTRTDLICIKTIFYYPVQFGGPNIYSLGFSGVYFISNGGLLYQREEGSPGGTQLAQTNLPNLAEWGAYFYQRLSRYRITLQEENN